MVAGRVVLAVLLLTSLTALTMSASTLGLVALDAGTEPEVASVAAGQPDLPGAQLACCRTSPCATCASSIFPQLPIRRHLEAATRQGEAWIDRYSGQMLASQDTTMAQKVYDWALVLHTGEGAWPWAVVLGFVGASVLLFWWSGVVIWWQARRLVPRISGNSPFGAGRCAPLCRQRRRHLGICPGAARGAGPSGHRVHTGALEHFQTAPATRQVFVLAATYGEGQAPAHAKDASSASQN